MAGVTGTVISHGLATPVFVLVPMGMEEGGERDSRRRGRSWHDGKEE